MSQSRYELEAALALVKKHARNRTWTLPNSVPFQLGLTTIDNPERIDICALQALVDYTRTTCGIDLDLVGGGSGCFDLVFSAEPISADAILDNAIISDQRFQFLLNSLSLHFARLRSPGISRQYSALHEEKILFATNRNRIEPAEANQDCFGRELADSLSFGIIEVLIFDGTPSQNREGLLKRIWRAVLPEDIRDGYHRIDPSIYRIEHLTSAEFTQLIRLYSGPGMMLTVHGYANNFLDAVRATAAMTHRGEIGRLGIMPVLFSWPSHGDSIKYLPDTALAENSEKSLGQVLQMVAIGNPSYRLTILAHSHGSKLLLRAIERDPFSTAGDKPIFHRFILVEPDVDQKFFHQRISNVLSICDETVLYYSISDRALGAAEAIFEAPRLGRAGPTSEIGNFDNRFIAIDVTKVSRGWMKHTPHVDCPEVLADLHYLLRNVKPNERFRLSATDDGHWRLAPTT